MTGGTRFTPIQRAMLDVLADGHPHTREELHACLYDDMGAMSNIRAHLTNLRKKLRPAGRDVACERVNGIVRYRLLSPVPSQSGP